jgi:hypothetical protein
MPTAPVENVLTPFHAVFLPTHTHVAGHPPPALGADALVEVGAPAPDSAPQRTAMGPARVVMGRARSDPIPIPSGKQEDFKFVRTKPPVYLVTSFAGTSECIIHDPDAADCRYGLWADFPERVLRRALRVPLGDETGGADFEPTFRD